MSSGRPQSSERSQARPVPASSSVSREEHFGDASPTRASYTAKLASPIPPQSSVSRSPQRIPRPTYAENDESQQAQSPLPGLGSGQSSLPRPGDSALAQALRGARGQSPPRFNTPPPRQSSPAKFDGPDERRSNYGSFEPSSGLQDAIGRSPKPEIIRKHLVQPASNASLRKANQEQATIGRGSGRHRRGNSGQSADVYDNDDEEEFSSLQLQGGDTHRGIYRWTEQAEAEGINSRAGPPKRSKSLDLGRPLPEDEEFDVSSIKQPQGFRRNYIRRAANDPVKSQPGPAPDTAAAATQSRQRPQFVANNFLEFLSLYGHFAGEELTEDDEVLEPDEYFSSDVYDDAEIGGAGDGEDRDYGEDSALLTPGKRKRRRKERPVGNVSAGAAAMMLLKSFVGTGVLFLPRAFYNGGMVFSNVVLLAVAVLSYYCFCLLTATRRTVGHSFGEMGNVLFGSWLKFLINFSLVLSQVGFVSAYIVFVSENLHAFFLAVSRCQWDIDLRWFIFGQMLIFMPISLIRQIHNLEKFVLVADALIVLGLVYLYYYDFSTLIANHWTTDIVQFNRDTWTLLIGTAIFTFEGIGLVIPIQSSMKDPAKFPRVLGLVMIGITVIFLSSGAFSYAAFGSHTKTVILLNMPQDDAFVETVQFLYSIAILLSTPLQIFPAIEIAAQQCFSKSGKYNPWIKWQKNFFRFFVVAVCTLIAWVGAGDLDKFVSLVGSFACIPLVFIYPPMLHYKAVSRTTFRRAMDIALGLFGGLLMAYTTGLTITSWIQGRGGKEPGYCDDR
ncbi:MAG: neutral amino acid transporter [Bathelium mastoideum]|nr:MAG: neutral amino acid transporter [Bathelium mastoideum]